MNYSLGNTLSRGGSLNADGLSLNLQFATDKTLTARKGPTPTFTRASTATFVGSNGLIQSAAINAARFDHDPVTLASKGLLMEEGRTNLVLQSENHPSASWSKTGLTVASASNTDPSGAATSNLVSEDTSVGLHRMFQSTAYVSGTSYSISCFLKYAGRQFVAITHPAVAANGVAIFDIQNGTITLSQAGITSSITAYPNGWYRCVINGVSTTTGGSSHIIQGSTTGGILTGSYSGLNGAAFYIYGSQVEAGAFPTSYIPTTTASVIRSADICSITGSDFTGFYNQSEGTIVGSGSTNQPTTVAGPLLFRTNDGTNNNVIQVGMTNSPLEAVRPIIVASGTTTYNNKHGTATVGVERKVGTAYKTNDAISAFNGTLGTLDTTVTPPTNCNTSSLFSGLGSGTISSFRYYKKRLSDAKLQTLTTL
jgi:hypothetical protein